MTKYGMASTSGDSSDVPSKPNHNMAGISDNTTIPITNHKLNGHNNLQWSQSVMMILCGKGKNDLLSGASPVVGNNLIFLKCTPGSVRTMKPKLHEVFSAVRHEESRRKLMPGPSSSAPLGGFCTCCNLNSADPAIPPNGLNSWNTAANQNMRQGRPWCDKCKKPNHTLSA